MDTKFCHSCSTEYPMDAFYANRGKKDGKSTQCKTCSNARSAAWAVSNKEKRRTLEKNYRDKNREKSAQACKQWRANNPDKVAALSRKWRANNPEKVREINLRQRALRGDKYRQAYKEKHPLRFKARTRVHNAVFLGKLPRVATLQCSVCDHQAEQYHHHKGYEEPHWLDVVPLCRKCHVIADLENGSYIRKS